MRFALLPVAAVALALLSACSQQEEAAMPDPFPLDAEAIGRYCGMNVLEHDGPKGQIILTRIPEPIWFSSARDAVAFTMLPDEPKNIAAIYVSDMAVAESWDEPGADNWIDADGAVYVVGATLVGGMGAPELVPFSSRETAQAFIAEHGGTPVTLEAVPDAMVLAPVEFEMDEDGNFLAPEGHAQSH